MSLKWKTAIKERRRQRQLAHCWRDTRIVSSAQQPFICIDGQWVTNFSSNDYLGLAADPRVSGAIELGLTQWGNGSAASHMVTGHSILHEQLTERLADWVGAEKAMLFSTGYMANLAVNTALFGKKDLLLHDKLNHASLIDGARLSAGKLRRFSHSNVQHARQILLRERFERFAVFVDGVFSMDGDSAPLNELADLVDHYQGLLIVDDAHGLGVIGKSGAGTLSSFNLQPSGSNLMIGTLGKALGGFGAFIAGDREFIDELTQCSRSYIYTTAMSNAVALGNLAALDVIDSDAERLLDELRNNVLRFRVGCEQTGIPISSSQTPIQPVLLGDAKLVVNVASSLLERGMMVAAIRTPTVKAGTERLRITISAAHKSDQIDMLIECLSQCLREAGCPENLAIA